MKGHLPTRRMFLVGAGGATLSIPFLPSLLPELARAAPVVTTKYVQVSSNYHADPSLLMALPPSHQPLVPVTRLDDATKTQSLEALRQATGSMLPGLAGPVWDALIPHVNVVFGSNLNCANDKHGTTSGQTMSCPHDVEQNDHPPNNNPIFKYSLDHLAEKRLATPSHLFSAIRTHLVYRHAQFDADGMPIKQGNGRENGWLPSEYTHYSFGGPDPTRPGYAVLLPEMRDVAELELKLAAVGSSDQPDPRRDRRRKLVDAVLDDYHRLVAHPRLSSVDRERLEGTVALWNEAKNRFDAGTSCELVPGPDGIPDGTGDTRAPWRVYHHYTMDLLGHALACGLTPVVTYVLNHAGDESPSNADEGVVLHGGQHNGGEVCRDMTSWRIDRMAYFADRLASLTDETGASLLDSSLLYWNHEYGSNGHGHSAHISLLVGKAGGRLRTGNYVDVSGESRPLPDNPYYQMYSDGVPLNRVGVTILRALGLSTEEIEIGGEPGFGEYADLPVISANDHRTGASAGWNNDGRAKYFSTEEKRKTLPIFDDV